VNEIRFIRQLKVGIKHYNIILWDRYSTKSKQAAAAQTAAGTHFYT